MEKLWEWLQKFWSIILFVIGAVTAAFQLVELWQGARDTFTWVAAAVGLLLITVTISYIAFAKTEFSSARAHTAKRLVPVFPKLYRLARGSLVLLLILTVLTGIVIYRTDLQLRNKLVVLVTVFDGPETNKYRVTDIVIQQLNNAVSQYNDTLIKPINRSISENDGSGLAKKLGKQYRADLVIWGWYGITDTNVILTVHVENVDAAAAISLPSNSYTLQNQVTEIESFEFQQQLSAQMTSLALFTGGILRYKAHDYNGALARLVSARDSYAWPEGLSGKDILFSYIGDTYVALHQSENALESYNSAIAVNPNRPRNFIDRCGILFLLNRIEDALLDCSKAIEIKPLIAGAYGSRAMMYIHMGDFKNALADAEAEIKAFPTDARSYAVRSYVLYGDGKLEEALKDSETSIRLAPNEAIYYENLAGIYSDLNDASNCLSMLNKAIRLSSEAYEQAAIYSLRSECYQHLGETATALSDINTSIKLDPTEADYYFSRASLYQDRNQLENALSDYSKAIELDPQKVALYINRGYIFLGQKSYQKALSDFLMATNLGPHTIRAWYALAITYTELREYNNAVLAFSKVLELNTRGNVYNGNVPFADVYYKRGLALVALGNTKAATEDFQAALASPDVDSNLAATIKLKLSELNKNP